MIVTELQGEVGMALQSHEQPQVVT